MPVGNLTICEENEKIIEIYLSHEENNTDILEEAAFRKETSLIEGKSIYTI